MSTFEDEITLFCLDFLGVSSGDELLVDTEMF